MLNKNSVLFFYFLFSLLFVSCGTSIGGNYTYAGEIDGSIHSEKVKTSITLKEDNTIKLSWSGGKTYEFWERRGIYHVSSDSTLIYTDFTDGKAPFTLRLQKGELTWQLIDSSSIYDKVVSKFERDRLKSKK